MASPRNFYKEIKQRRYYIPETVEAWFAAVSRERVELIARRMEDYITTNLPEAIRNKSKLADYRTNPYVLMATAGALQLDDVRDLAKFLVDIKLYMGLETSFGKSIESVVMSCYPTATHTSGTWDSPAEKQEEFDSYKGLTQEEKNRRRSNSIWREIDTACVHERRRHLLTIKSGVQTINDTQVGGMFTAIREHNQTWLESSMDRYDVDGIDVVVGLTYGTDWATNNKENQILNKLLDHGFSEVDRKSQPGVLANSDGTVRVYRAIGVGYWGYTANPSDPAIAEHTFLEVLLGLARALRLAHERSDVGAALNERLDLLGDAFKELRFPGGDRMPSWVGELLGVKELSWLSAAMSAFFDERKPST